MNNSDKAKHHSAQLNAQHAAGVPMNVQDMMGHIIYGHPYPGADWLFDLNVSRQKLNSQDLQRLQKGMVSAGYQQAVTLAEKGDFQKAGWAKQVSDYCGGANATAENIRQITGSY